MKEAFLSLFFAWRIQSSCCLLRHMVWRKMLFEEFQDDYSVDGHLWYLSGMIKAILGLHFALKNPISFMIKRKYGLEDVVWRIPRWLFMILFIISLHVAWCLPSSFCSRKYVDWKKLFEKFHEGCLVHANRLYLRGMKEAFLVPFLVWRIQSIFFSWGPMVWRKMLFEEYQDCCLVLGQPDIWIKCVYLFWASMLPGFC